MIREDLIKQMVENYNSQLEIALSVGLTNKMTLRQYLQGIKEIMPPGLTQEEVEYGMSLQVNGHTPAGAGGSGV